MKTKGKRMMGFCVAALAIFFLFLDGQAAELSTKKALKPSRSSMESRSSQSGPLPDLMVEKVWLDGRNRVVFRLKNKGKGSISTGLHGKAKVRVSAGRDRKDYFLKAVDPRRALARAGGVVSFTTEVELSASAKVTVEVDSTGQIPEVREDNNLLSVLLGPKAVISRAPGPAKTPLKGVGPSKLRAEALVEVQKVYLKGGTVHVLLRNRGGTLSRDEIGQISLVLQVGGEASTWHLKDVDPRSRLLHPQGTVEFDTGIRIGQETEIKAYTKRVGRFELAQPPFVAVLPEKPADHIVFSNLDLTVKNISKSQRNDVIFISYATGNPDIQILDRPITFDVRVSSFYRPAHDAWIEDVELVNDRFILSPREVYLNVPITWPHYLKGIHVQVTINPDRTIAETDYENNTSLIFLWERDTYCVRLLPWPGNAAEEKVFSCRGWNGVISNWESVSLRESEVRSYIERGIFTYLPGGQHGEQDMLIIPMRVAIGKCSAQSNEAKYFMKYTTYNGLRTIEGNVSLAMGETVLNFDLLLKIQDENLFQFWLEHGPHYGIRFRFVGLPWDLY